MKTAPVVSALFVALALVSPLAGDEIRLRDGRVIEGEVLSAPGEAVVDVRTRIGGMTAVIHLKAADVVTIAKGQTSTQQRQAAFDANRSALGSTGGTVQQWWALALEAKALGEHQAERDLARQVIAMEPNHAAARAVLGQIKQEGTWMTPAEAATARGEVFFRGRWVPAAQRDATLAEEERVAQVKEEREAKARAERAAELELAKKEADARTAKADAAAALARQREAEADARAAAIQAVQPTTQVIYTTVTPTYPTIWNRPGYYYVQPGTCQPSNGTVIISPRLPCPPPTVVTTQGSGLVIQASGQGNGYQWFVQSK